MERASKINQRPMQREAAPETDDSRMREMAPPPFQLTADGQQGESTIGPGTVRQHSKEPPEMDMEAGDGFDDEFK